MQEPTLYQEAFIQDRHFPIQISKKEFVRPSNIFLSHWHEAMEILVFENGSAIIETGMGKKHYHKNDIAVINANELHTGYGTCAHIAYHCIDIGPSLLHSGSMDICDRKYIEPLARNIISFRHKISDDSKALCLIRQVIDEFTHRQDGYELAIKSFVGQFFVYLLRNYVQHIFSKKEWDIKQKNFDLLKNALLMIENHYREKLTLHDLSKVCGLSVYHFCHVFKQVIGRSPAEYTNRYRLSKAETLLAESSMNITEVAMSTGFSDANYFSRMFRKYKDMTPSQYRKKAAD